MARHSDGCDCAPCLLEFRQRNLWLGSIWCVLAGVGLLCALDLLYTLFIR